MSKPSNKVDALSRTNETEYKTRNRSNCVSNTALTTGDNISKFRQFFNLNSILPPTSTTGSLTSVEYRKHIFYFV